MSFHEKVSGSFPVSQSTMPSPTKQPAPKTHGPDALAVPDLPIPAETHMEHGGHDKDDFSDEEGFESSQPAAFHAAEQLLTALPSMDKSPEKQRASHDSAVGLHIDKNLPPPPQSKRLFGFLREKHAAAGAGAVTTTTTDPPATSRGRRVMTSVGGGLRALRLLTRSHADLRKESSRSAASSLHLPVSVPADQPLPVSPSVSPASEQFLVFPLPPGSKVQDMETMRVRASLGQELEEEDPPVLEPVGSFGRSSVSIPRTRGRQQQQQQQQQVDLEARSRSPSTETVIRHPRVSSTETLVRAARRASIPARLPLSPVVLGRPVVAVRPSPAVGVFAAVDTIAMSAAAEACRIHRQGFRNFSRPFAVGRQGAVGGSGEEARSEVVEADGEGVGLAISMGPSPVKRLQRQQSASLAGECVSPVDDVPADWPLRKMRSFGDSAALDKPLPALPEEDRE